MTSTRAQAARLRRNYLDHLELPNAITAVRARSETSPGGDLQKEEFIGCLEGLAAKLSTVFDTISTMRNETGTAVRSNSREQGRLENALWDAWEKVDADGGLPEDRIQEQLTLLDGKKPPVTEA